MTRRAAMLLLLFGPVGSALASGPAAVSPQWLAAASGAELLTASIARHRLPAGALESLTMTVTDKAGHRQTRQLSLHRRDSAEGTRAYWLRFDSPEQVAGVTLRAARHADGSVEGSFLLPALGPAALPAQLVEGRPPLPGSDFLLQDFDGPSLARYRIERLRDRRVNGVQHLVLELHSLHAVAESASRLQVELLADTLSIVRTTHFDHAGRVLRVRSGHDLRSTAGGSLWPALIHVSDYRSGRDTLLRVQMRSEAATPPALPNRERPTP